MRTPLALVGVLTAAVVALAVAVIRQDMDIALLALHTTRALPVAYALGAVAAAPAGSLLVITWGVALVAGASLGWRNRTPAPLGQVSLLSGSVALSAAILLVASPFARLGYTPLEGGGVGVAPRHPLALVEAVFLFAGVAALGAAALVAVARRMPLPRRTNALVVAWILLSIGLGLRLWRVYAVDAPDAERVWRHLGAGATGAWLVAGAVFHLGQRPRIAEVVSLSGLALASLAALLALVSPSREVRLAAGEQSGVSVPFGTVTLTHLGTSRFEIPGGLTAAVTLETKAGGGGTLLSAERHQYLDLYGRQVGAKEYRPSRLAGFGWDLRITAEAVDGRPASRFLADDATYHLTVFPLAWCAWLGFALMAFGGLMAAGRRPAPVPA
ncbi:MAG: hypothetical protein EXR93_02985 [Gemmatimonadetes bacterium]|nr:hypothetical protein [Gemmatimonadota bacterium]